MEFYSLLIVAKNSKTQFKPLIYFTCHVLHAKIVEINKDFFMKKFIIYLLLVCSIAVAISACKQKEQPMDLLDMIKARGKIVVGVKNDAKPFAFIDENGNYAGYDIDIAKILARILLNDENAVEFVHVSTSDKIKTVNSGNADMIVAAMSITPQRLEVVDFSHAYYISGQTLLLKQNSKITSVQNINKSRIGVVFGSTAEKNIRELCPLARILGFKTYAEAVHELQMGNIDALAGDEALLLKYKHDNKNLKLLENKYTQEPYGIAFRKGTEAKRVIKIVNDAIETMILDGSLIQLQKKWNIN